MSDFLVYTLFALGLVAFRVVVDRLDRWRIQEYFDSRGETLDECSRSPLGTGWLGAGPNRIYEISYRDREGRLRVATCKTSLFAGVYLTEE